MALCLSPFLKAGATFVVFQSVSVCTVWKDCKYKAKNRCSFFLENFENSTTDIVWVGSFMRIAVA